ncbi:MAG: phage portal protein [Solirubrobacterales bacterium]
MSRFADYLLGRDLEPNGSESRALEAGTVPESIPPVSRTALPTVSETTALRIADVFAAVRVLADALASLPPRVYRETSGGRVPAGEDQRLVALMRRPEPGSTSADLLSTLIVHLIVHGDAFLAKYRSEGTITQLGLLDPQAVVVERKGDRVIYRLSRREGISHHGPSDIVHVKAMSPDGLRGLSTVRAAGKVLGLNQGLIDYACNFLGNAARPGGILAVTGDQPLRSDHAADLKSDWQELFAGQAPGAGAGRIAVLSGDDMSFERVEPPMKDSEFLAQRELAAREVARVFNLPPWALGTSSGDALTYSNVASQNRYLVDHSLRPWIERIERALSNDADLCPGGAYLVLDTDALLRADPAQRADFYEKAIAGGWLTVDEVREREDLPPLGGAS